MSAEDVLIDFGAGQPRGSRHFQGPQDFIGYRSKLEFAPDAFGKIVPPSLRELPTVLADDDMGFYIVDKHGVVRYSLAGSYVVEGASRPIPSNEEIVQELKRCEGKS